MSDAIVAATNNVIEKKCVHNQEYSAWKININSQYDEPVALSVEAVQVPRFCHRYYVPPCQCAAFSISNVLSAAECQFLIQYSERSSNNNNNNNAFKYITEATHVAPDGSSYLVPIHNPNPHKLSVFYYPPIVSTIWHRLKPLLLTATTPFFNRTNCGDALGLNPRIRILRYDAHDNDRFEPHFDATTYVDSTQQSLLTVLIYLNSGGGIDFSGGETCYLDVNNNNNSSTTTTTKVIAETGKAILFEHDLYHSGAPLLSGTKYVLRTDVCFQTNSEEEESNKVTTATTSTPLVIDVCRSLNLTAEEMSHLDDICILDMTLENLFAISTSLVQSILQDSGLPQVTVDRFLHATLAILENTTTSTT